MYFVAFVTMANVLKQHIIARAITDMVLDAFESHGLTYTDWVDYSFNRGMLRTVASVDVHKPPGSHLPNCLRCRCGNCAANLEVRDRVFAWSSPVAGHQREQAAALPAGRVS